MSCFLRAFILATLVLLSGCYLGSDEPLILDAEALPVLPNETEGYVTKDGEPVRIGFLRIGRTNSYHLTPAEDYEGAGAVRLFDIGAREGFYGMQIDTEDGGAFYSIVGLRFTPTVQIDVYEIDRSPDRLRQGDYKFVEEGDGAIKVASKRDLLNLITHALRDGAVEMTGTIQTTEEGWRKVPDATGAAKVRFATNDYVAGDLLQAIYDDRTDGAKAATFGLYLMEFATLINNVDDPACWNLLTDGARINLAVIGPANSFAILFGGWAETHRNAPDGRDAQFAHGFKGATNTFLGIAGISLAGQRDARQLYRTHGCSSETTRRFYRNFNDFVIGR